MDQEIRQILVESILANSLVGVFGLSVGALGLLAWNPAKHHLPVPILDFVQVDREWAASVHVAELTLLRKGSIRTRSCHPRFASSLPALITSSPERI